jgi:hypothetical protein
MKVTHHLLFPKYQQPGILSEKLADELLSKHPNSFVSNAFLFFDVPSAVVFSTKLSFSENDL